jgi:hypothetical protein
MSTIHEALKKSGQPIIGQSDEKKPATSFRLELEPPRKRSGVRKGSFFVFAVVALIATPLLASLFSNSFPKRTPSEAILTPRIIRNSNRLAQFGIEETAVRPMTASSSGVLIKDNALPQFLLSGVVYSDNGSYCLINGKVLKRGENIGGAIVEKISPNGVLLDYLGEKIVVPVIS